MVPSPASGFNSASVIAFRHCGFVAAAPAQRDWLCLRVAQRRCPQFTPVPDSAPECGGGEDEGGAKSGEGEGAGDGDESDGGGKAKSGGGGDDREGGETGCDAAFPRWRLQ